MQLFQYRYLLTNFLIAICILIDLFQVARAKQTETLSLSYTFNKSLGSNEIFYQEFIKIETVNSLTPTLKWIKSENAIKYLLVIKEFEENPEKSKPVIIRTFELSDTFFTIPAGILEEKNFYSWNVKSFNGKVWSDFGEEFYFKVDLKKRATIKLEKKPETFSPGKFYPNIEIIKTLVPEFKWFRVDGSIAYNFNLERKEQDGSFKKIFSSDEFGLVKDTFFIIKGNLLKEGVIYRWNIKASFPSGFSDNSDYRFFKIILPKIEVRPDIFYPGYKIENKEVIGTTTPTFVWKKIQGAENYSLAISKKGSDGKYKLIFDTEGKYQILDTLFKIPEGILENNSSYRWNLKVHLIDGRFLYSHRLYFKVVETSQPSFEVPKIEIEENADYEEILINMEYGGIVNAFVNAVYQKDKILVHLQEFLDNLKIPFSKDGKNIINIFLTDEAPAVMDFGKKTFKSDNIRYQFNEEDYLELDNDYFVSLQLLEKILSIKIDFNFSDLTIQVQSEKPLPVYSKYLIEQKFYSLKRKDKEKISPLLFDRERYFLNGFIFDYQISHSLMRYQRSNFYYNFALGGELLYGDFYYSSQQFLINNLKNKIDNYNWKYTFNPNSYLTQISIGDDYFEGINSYTYRGISVTNEVVEPRKKIGNYIYEDNTSPNSLVELYINNELIDIAKSDQSGKYSFEIPLKYGMSNLEFRIHTPKGETKIYRKVYQIPYELLPAGIFNYRLTSGFTRFVKYKLFFSEFSYGLTDYLTLSSGSEYLQDSTNKNLNFFGKSTLRISSNLLLNFFYSPKIYSKLQGSFVRPNFTSYVFEYINFKKNKFYNPSNLKNSFRGSFYLPFKLERSELSFYLNHEYFGSDVYKRYNIGIHSFYLHKWFGFNAGIIGENINLTSLIKRRELVFGTTINFNNILIKIPILNRSYLSTRSNYDFLKKRFQNLSIFTTTTLMQYVRFQFNYEKFFTINSTNFSLNIFFELPQTRYLINSNLNDVIQHQLTGSIGYSPQINQLYLFNEPLIGRASIYLEGYADKNNNNLKDEDENSIKGLDFSINSASYSNKIKDGKLFLGLNPYQRYTIRLNEAGINQPNYSFEISEFDVSTDGNRLKIIRLPYVEMGEIGGLIVRKFEGEEIPLSNVKLVIKNLNDDKEHFISTFSDGSFYFFGLKKGKYILKIDDNYLNRNSLKSKPEIIEFEINPIKNQLTIENLRFVLE